MRRVSAYNIAVFMLCALLCLAVIIYFQSPSENPLIYDLDRKVKYSFTLINKSNAVKRNVRFYVYAPVETTSSQLTQSIQSSLPYRLVKDELGNQLLQYEIDILPPFASKVVKISAKVNMASTPNNAKLTEQNSYVLPEKNIESDNEKILAISNQLRSGTDIETAERLLSWVHTNIKYSGYIKDDRGALYALNNREGDCTEYMYLYTALARASSIPTRGVAGYVYGEDAVFKPNDFHNWSEIYIDGKWRIVDPQNGRFLENESHYIAMRILSDRAAMPDQLNNSQQFAVAHSDIVVRMN